MPLPIQDYALIGDCETAALVGRDGSIDWLCWPRFDSGACFAAILGKPEHGRWLLAPAGSTKRTTRRYRKDTLVLETEFETDHGAVTILDFMPLRKQHSYLVRLVRGSRGRVRMQMELVLRFDYGRSVPWVTRVTDGSLRAIAGPNMVVLRTPAPLRGEQFRTVSEFTLNEGETVPFVLSYSESNGSLPRPIDGETALRQTEAFWRRWSRQCAYQGAWAEAVQRSLITLKATAGAVALLALYALLRMEGMPEVFGDVGVTREAGFRPHGRGSGDLNIFRK